ncbi:MAG: hypothetical protein JRF60_00950 [Deltaproteobacteria bacterium]|nr:hypothetical protein [Deltaproteobacteria bacterium]MBW2562728.1 hypothetical protein [Deltaproteobacteria bacterium]
MINLKENVPLLGKFAYCILTGVFGVAVLAMFLAVFIELYRVVPFVPWIIAFNSAMTGYSLMDKTRDTLKYKQVSSIIAGILNVIITCLLLSIFSLYFFGENLFSIWDFALFLIIGIVCSELGALLAIKYFKLKR